MNSNELIKAELLIYNIRRYKNDWVLAEAEVISCKDTDTELNQIISVKGVLSGIKDNVKYIVTMIEENDSKYGLQYMIKSFYPAVSFDDDDYESQKEFLKAIFTEYQIENMYAAIDNPFIALRDKDAKELIKIKGCGMKNATNWIKKFELNIGKSKIFLELGDFNLTNAMIDKLLDRYVSPDNVINKIKNNPYILCNEVDGVGWKTADKIALNGGVSFDSVKRIKAFINYYLALKGEEGCSWITPDELLGAVLELLGDEIPDSNITIALKELITEGVVWHNEDKTKLGLKKYYNIELKIAEELIRIRDAKSDIQICSNWEEKLHMLEKKQGWEFTDEQFEGIKTGLQNNITVITGKAGTGKTSLVSGVLEILNDCTFAQAALSGRAGSRMNEVTGQEGFTIHRLLGFPSDDELAKNMFYYNDDNPLGYDLYIIDEISMIDSYLFYYLLRAIPSGSKVYFLGDPAQLESIGSGNVAYDMIHSEEIATVFLTKIHRQAAKSAIITESLKIARREQIIEKDWVGTEVRGELQDLKITCFSDASNTFYEIMKSFNSFYNKKDFDIMQTQIIVPIKNRGHACTYDLNNTVQELFNPSSHDKNEVTCFSNGKSYILRVGDKVKNTKNNYKVHPTIYNGNIGIIKDITYDYDLDEEIMVIDFLSIGEVILEHKYWNNIELAYALTTHSMQGSQFDNVIFGIDFSSYALLSKEQIYTAITRAKKYCHLIAQTGALRYATAQEGVSKKQTHLQDCLHDVTHPKFIF